MSEHSHLSPGYLRLGVNIDHVATIRNARGGRHPDPVAAAHLAVRAGADGITAHLREDRRHISDGDIARLKAELTRPLNLEMAATPEMLAIALRARPHACCLVPERREERTTEGGLDVISNPAALRDFVARLRDSGIRVSLFIEPDRRAIESSAAIGADIVELHTGTYCERAVDADTAVVDAEAARLRQGAELAAALGLEVHAGHGLTYDTVAAVAVLPQMKELNIGHFIIGEAIAVGLEEAVQRMRRAMDSARGPADLVAHVAGQNSAR
jgi:pyridoxine 5-phosphate synthase